ncbi:hypothetical protein [Novosphingobium sp. CCH12-A3]|uniref:hypothetical protein n=1 Tax=Novosphingobium sp. CCH12-A3 TaxID=1768752 RepID=UPI000784BF19|nr:hypothetical protein [Novosphingobium sp. CCH12-A3]
MQRYLIWKSGPGPLQVEFRRVGEAILRPSLQIVTPTGSDPLPRQDDCDVARFSLSDGDVERVLAARGGLRPPCLMLQCDAFLGLACDQRRWGWSIRVSREGEALPCYDLDGTPLPLRRDGFTRAQLQRIPERSGMARSHQIIGLS